MKTTFSRSFTTAVIILLLALIVVGTSFRMLVSDFLMDTTVENLLNEATTIASMAEAYAVNGVITDRNFLVNLDVASRVSGADALICDIHGEIVMCSNFFTGCSHEGLMISGDYIRQVVDSGVDIASGVMKDLYPEQRYVVSAPIIDQGTGIPMGIVIVSLPAEQTTRVLHKITNIFLFVSLLVVLIAILAMVFFTRRNSDPIRQVSRTAVAFGHGNLNARVELPDDCPEEIEDLALAFNNMASALQKSEYQRQEFVANVSHELKTPMTTISGYIDGILDGTIPEERQDHYLKIVSDETKRLSRLVRSMLDISRLQDQGIPEEKKLRFDLQECAGQVLITFEQKITEKELEVDVDWPEYPVYTFADPDAVTQVIYNLLDNAVKFCPQGGQLGLSIKTGRGKVYVSISNSGETIPAEELPLVFDRFHKMDKSRSQNRDGWGLGLYIVKTLVGCHGENISVTSREGKTAFTFTMPLVN